MLSTKLALTAFFAVSPAFATLFQSRDSTENANSSQWPAPPANGGKAWASAFAKANATAAQMTVEELVNLTTGVFGPCAGNLGAVPRLNIPQLCLDDGPTGPRDVHGGSQFPAELTTAATWDRELMFLRTKAMGQEFHDQGVHIPLAPVTGGPLGRTPLEGRGWEGSFTDPYACGEASYQYVAGLLEGGVAPVSKHWIAYEQETFRNPFGLTESDTPFPLLTMHEVYMWAFAEAVRAGVSLVMCSYNRVNNTHACNSAKGLNNLLKTELNFQGSVVSDWGGQWNSVPSALNGLDISMPGSGDGGVLGDFWGDTLITLVNNGTISKDIVREKVVRTLTPYYFLGQDVNPLPPFIFNLLFPNTAYRNVRKPGTAELIREIGTSSITLLKNTGGLPLRNPQRVAVLGNDAGNNVLGTNACGPTNSDCPLNNLVSLTTGGGSGSTFAPYIVTPLDALTQRVIQDNAEIGAIISHTNNSAASEAILALLPDVDVTLVFLNRWSTEGADADDLVAQAVSVSSNVVVVIHTTGVVNIEKWADNENVTAIVVAYLPGQEAGSSLVPVLYGDVSPSGKLPWTWGTSLADYPVSKRVVDDHVLSPQANFTEGVFIDYRWFDKQNITPRYGGCFPFGFGLSYTTFDYSDLVIDSKGSKDNSSVMETAEPFVGSDGTNSLYDVLFTASATIKNTGNVTGSEVAQLYISIPEEGEPVRVLRGFDKVKNVTAGARATASFPVRRKDVSVWSVVDQQWFVPNGTFKISVGSSSRNLPLVSIFISVGTLFADSE
ncbi:beta-D-xylosidase/beta-D-glucosidase [Rhodocollybia butyracea]|uniref:Probable beta-glucosidase G n=1 Tax=Rhodocollybia butyracea TaxID=206335 RepID=A0A9P5P621_9AGAR|nr:beta-D-xylosidase/beta-D-glucosidase [Rhodocollybia butyracea]